MRKWRSARFARLAYVHSPTARTQSTRAPALSRCFFCAGRARFASKPRARTPRVDARSRARMRGVAPCVPSQLNRLERFGWLLFSAGHLTCVNGFRQGARAGYAVRLERRRDGSHYETRVFRAARVLKCEPRPPSEIDRDRGPGGEKANCFGGLEPEKQPEIDTLEGDGGQGGCALGAPGRDPIDRAARPRAGRCDYYVLHARCDVLGDGAFTLPKTYFGFLGNEKSRISATTAINTMISPPATTSRSGYTRTVAARWATRVIERSG